MMRAWSLLFFIVDGTYDDESDFDHRPMHQLWSKIAKQHMMAVKKRWAYILGGSSNH